MGYNESFLGNNRIVPLPKLTAKISAYAYRNGYILNYKHFSLVMHKKRRFAIYCAYNIDRTQYIKVNSSHFRYDRKKKTNHDIKPKNQIGDKLYDDNKLDRGHIARRSALTWGRKDAKQANKDSFYFTNIAPQHEVFNREGGVWRNLEEAIAKEYVCDRVCAFAGPILTDKDVPYSYKDEVIEIPRAFWKIVVSWHEDEESLAAYAFLMKQDVYLKDIKNIQTWSSNSVYYKLHELEDLREYWTYVKEIDEITGLDFGQIFRYDVKQRLHPLPKEESPGVYGYSMEIDNLYTPLTEIKELF